MTIKEMHERIILLKRQGQGGYHTPEDIDRALNDASNDKYNEEKRMFELNGFISDNLSNFKTSSTVTFTSGFGNKPALYDYRTNAATISGTPALNNLKVEIVPDGEWIERLADPIDVVSETRPICAIRDQIEIAPSMIASMKLFYLKRPATMVFGYTEDGDGNAIYDSGTSTDSDWPASCDTDVILRALGYLGIALPDDIMLKAKQYKKSTENV